MGNDVTSIKINIIQPADQDEVVSEVPFEVSSQSCLALHSDIRPHHTVGLGYCTNGNS